MIKSDKIKINWLNLGLDLQEWKFLELAKMELHKTLHTLQISIFKIKEILTMSLIRSMIGVLPDDNNFGVFNIKIVCPTEDIFRWKK